jgi:hypothetical protein
LAVSFTPFCDQYLESPFAALRSMMSPTNTGARLSIIYIADGYFHVAVTVTNLLQNGERRASIQEASGLTFVNKQAGTQRMLSVRGVLHVSAGSS